LFANKNIRPIYLKKLQFIDAGQITEYRIPVKPPTSYKFYDNRFFNGIAAWRYNFAPRDYVEFHRRQNYAVLNSYEDRAQLVDFISLTDWTINAACVFARMNYCNQIAFWYEGDFEHEHLEKIQLPTWKMYKVLGECDIPKIIKTDKLRMGQSDVF